MKKAIVLCALLALIVAVPMAMAQEKPVNCCVHGKLEKVTAAECKKKGGKVVKSEKECKPVKPAPPKKAE